MAPITPAVQRALAASRESVRVATRGEGLLSVDVWPFREAQRTELWFSFTSREYR
jgi:hypothetical protein